MLRTQEATMYGNGMGEDGMAALCEAICLDVLEVVEANRVSIWFFDDKGDMVCRRQLDSRDGRFQQGAVIPRSATQAYINAASRGLDSITTEDAPVSGNAGDVKARLDMLLVDSQNTPAAIFRCERYAGPEEWRPRDITILRDLAQTLAAAIRQQYERQMAQAMMQGPLVAVSNMGSVKQDLSWLHQGSESSIWLQSVSAASAFDALGLQPPMPTLDTEAAGFDFDEDEAF